MKITPTVQSFFTHYSLQFAIQSGWDLEQQYVDFFNEKIADFKESICLTLTCKPTAIDVTEYDIAMLSLGKVTETGKALLEALNNIVCEDDQVLLSSMHSGSSDYLYAKDIRELFAKNN